MKKVLNIDKKIVKIIYDENCDNVPLILLNTFEENIDSIYEDAIRLTDKKFILVTISNIDWNNDLSPWYMKNTNINDSDYSGNADKYLELLTDKILDEIDNEIDINISEYILGGYSLAGLFALYSIYKTDKFSKIISCSSSLWYPNYLEFVKKTELLSKPDKIYFSLGNKEHMTSNKLLKNVRDNTVELEKYYKKMNIETTFEENIGNHFQEINNRIAKGIAWVLK